MDLTCLGPCRFGVRSPGLATQVERAVPGETQGAIWSEYRATWAPGCVQMASAQAQHASVQQDATREIPSNGTQDGMRSKGISRNPPWSYLKWGVTRGNARPRVQSLS